MKEQRLNEMEKYVIREKTVSLKDLCTRYSISESTVRRDVDELLKRGNIDKIYGGVRVSDNPPSKSGMSLIPYSERNTSHMAEKMHISNLGASLIKRGDVIFIDTGSTCANMLSYVDENLSFTVITNSYRVASVAVLKTNVDLIMLPGKLNRETLSFVGMETVKGLMAYNIDKAFMAATGINYESGLTNASSDEYIIKREVVKRSNKIYAMVDESKFGKKALYTYCSFNDLDLVITDKSPEEEYVQYCSKRGIEIIY